MPAVINRRLSGYTPGLQQFEYPVHLLSNASGSASIKVAAGAQTGLFGSSDKVPPNEPHGYRPNEFFINNWIYEGLVSYGQDGLILPQLAISWRVSDLSGGGQEYRFTLRSGVTFHDGAQFTCASIKMTFDHVLEPPLNGGGWHGWYLLPANLESWECQGEVFVAKTSQVYYPFLQELSFIRPLRILSPNCYANGASSSPVTSNSCPTGWDGDISELTCAGVQCVAGTGPWKYTGQTLTSDGHVEQMRFTKHEDWWGNRGDVTELILKGFKSAADAKQALLAGELDMVVGGGALTPLQVREFEQTHSADFQVLHGPPLMNTIIVMNAAKAPTNDIKLRKLIMHAVNKAAIVDTELAGSSIVADSLFAKDMPYCNIDLTPRWDYDIEKAQLLNCPSVVTDFNLGGSDEKSGSSDPLIVVLGIVGGIVCLAIIGVACFYVGRTSGYSKFSEEQKKRKEQEAGDPASVIGANASV